jgi:peptide/nickel transport system ATP-binding protein
LRDHPKRLLTIKDFEESREEIPEPSIQKPPEIRSGEFPMLSVRNLSVSYSHPGLLFGSSSGKVSAVNQVSFDVFKGETLGLVGESGCGKTTLGRTILRLMSQHEGEIWYKGKKIDTLNREQLRLFRKNVQVVFQDPYSSLNPKHPVFEMLGESLRFHFPHLDAGERHARIADLLHKVGLSGNDMFKYPHQFSGGERQRICIARSLSPEPEFLILDEAVASLDVSVQAQILNLLNDLKEYYKLTYIFISHDLAVVKYMAGRMLIMYRGKIEETGHPDEIFSSPSSAYTRKLIESIPGYQNSI